MARPPKRRQIGRPSETPHATGAHTTSPGRSALSGVSSENANDALALFNPDGTIALVNRAAEHIPAIPARNWSTQHYRKVVTGGDGRGLAAERVAESAGEGTAGIEPFEAELVRKDGSVVLVEARDRLLWDATGTVARVPRRLPRHDGSPPR